MNEARPLALVTGASSGIGEALAIRLAEEGYDLIITARREDRLRALADDLSRRHQIVVTVLPVDLSRSSSADELYDAVKPLGRALDVLINNAGFGSHGSFLTTNGDEQAAMLRVNVEALCGLTHRFGRDMLTRGRGRILNIASTAAFQPGPLMSVYYASKAFVLNFSQALAFECRGTGVTVTVLCPGPVQTEFQQRAGIENTRLFSSWPLPTSREVADFGYRCMMKGTPVAIHGRCNAFAAWLTRFLPRSWTTAIACAIQQKKG